MEITIKGTEKEIAALVSELQKQKDETIILDGRKVVGATTRYLTTFIEGEQGDEKG